MGGGEIRTETRGCTGGSTEQGGELGRSTQQGGGNLGDPQNRVNWGEQQIRPGMKWGGGGVNGPCEEVDWDW